MKKVLVFALILMSFSNVSFAKAKGALSLFGVTDELKTYCSEANTNHSANCLKAFLAYRCTVNYLFTSPTYAEECVNAVEVLVNELDITQVAVPKEQDTDSDLLKLHQVAFSSDLLLAFLKRNDSFKTMIDQYQSEFDDSYRFAKAHSIWDRTLLDAQNNKEKALLRMVTLFQDFSSVGYMQFIDSYTDKTTPAVKQRMEVNLKAIYQFYESVTKNRVKVNNNPNYALFPEVTGAKDMTTLIHHFYTPAYLALRLTKYGYSSQVAFYVALLFNTSYEFIKLDKKMGTKRWPYRDPKAFDAKTYSLQVQKIYTGYVGALWGVGKESKAMSLADFSKKLAADPSGFISSVHHTDF